MRKLLTIEEVEKILQLNYQTAIGYIKSGKLKAVKLEKGYRITEEDLNKFIEENKTKGGDK